MLLKWFVLCLCAIPVFTGSGKKCSVKCVCNMDEANRYQAICTKGDINAFPRDLSDLDPDVRIIIIKVPRNIITVQPYVFKQFEFLEVLRITNSNLPAIGVESFWGLQYLRILDLSKNNITNITENNFRGQDNLLELDLSKNKISFTASSTFRHLKDLRRLNLADNLIDRLVQRNFFMLTKLKYLDLSGNPLQDLPPDVFRDVSELKVFKCRSCQLKKINPQLYNLLPLLSELDLGRNEFKFLDKDEFRDVKRLTKVLLDGNQLSVVVDELFRMQRSLNHLDLSYNRLAKVPNDSFQNLGNLTFLDLSYNKLVRLEPQSVRNLGNLRILNISGNVQMDLLEMRQTFEIIPQLTHLAVADMGILPVGLLVPFKQLRYLNISGNHLDSLSLQVIDPCRELEFLDLSRNQLYGINEDIALRIQAIRNVRLDNNPLICDECHMGKLINVVRHLQWKWESYPICFLPKSLRGAEITDLDVDGLDRCLEYITDEEQNAASTSHNFLERGGLNTLAILGGIIFVLIVISILAMIVCFSKHHARYYTRERLSGSEAKCLDKNFDAASPTTAGTIADSTIPTEPSDVRAAAPNDSMSGSNSDKNAEGSEINFKFPIDDRVCTVDEHVLPPPPTPPLKNAIEHQPSGQTMYSTTPVVNGNSGSTTAMAAVAAATTVIPPGAPSTIATPPPPHPLPHGNSHQQHQQQQHHQQIQSYPHAHMTHAPTCTAVQQQQHSEAVVVMLPPLSNTSVLGTEQKPQQQQPQQVLHLTTLEPLVSVN